MNRLNTVLIGTIILLHAALACAAEDITILVNPFKNNGNPRYDWISDGMNATAISDLSKVDSVQVITQKERAAAMEELKLSLSGLIEEEQAIDIGKWQGAQYILAGSYQVNGNRIRANAELIDIKKGTVVISVKEDGTVDRIFDFQDALITSILSEADKLNLGGVPWHSALEEYKTVALTSTRPGLSAYEEFSMGNKVRNTDPATALKHYQKALEIEPGYFDALFAAGTTVISFKHDLKKGQEYYERAEEVLTSQDDDLTAQMADLLIEKAHLAVLRKQYQDAGNCLDNAEMTLDLIGGHNRLRCSLEYRRGELLYKQGQYAQALLHYEKSAENLIKDENRFDPGLVRIYIAQGQTMRAAGRSDDAIEKYNEAADYLKRFHKTNSSLYADLMFNRGTALKDKGLINDAVRDYVKARELYLKLGLDESATYFIILGNLGGLLGTEKKWNEAAELFKEAVWLAEKTGNTENPDYPTYIYMEGLCHYIEGEHEKAGPLFRKAFDVYTGLGLSGKKRDSALQYAEELGY